MISKDSSKPQSLENDSDLYQLYSKTHMGCKKTSQKAYFRVKLKKVVIIFALLCKLLEEYQTLSKRMLLFPKFMESIRR